METNTGYKTIEDVEQVIGSARQDIARMRLRRHRVSAWKAANLAAWIEDAEARLARDILIWRSQGWDVQ